MSWLVRLLFGLLSFWYKILPRSIHLTIHDVVSNFLSWIPIKVIERNLRVINRLIVKQGNSPLNFREIRRKFWFYTLKNTMDYMLFLFDENRELEDLVVWKSGEDILQKAYDRGKGVIGICLHIGNWELGGRVLTEKNFKLSSLVFEQLNPALEHLISKTRKNFNIELLHQRKGLRTAVKNLQAGHIVTVLCDQDGTRAGHFVNFFDLPLSFPRVFELFFNKTDASLVPLIILHSNSGYELHALPEWQVDRKNLETWLPIFYEELSRHLEHWIVKCPEQWLLVYDRFKLRHQKKWQEEGRFEEIKIQYENIWRGML
ncbi:MAG: lysophospholipid acyltransferase family protein [bacterium]|nr:lysophospholipid acyltransferase family protein [bacterium]